MFLNRRIATSGGGDKFRDEFSVAFDGSNDYVLTDFKPDYIHTNATIAFWVKMNDFSSSQVMGIHNNKRWYFGFDTSNLFIGVANTHNGSSLITPSPALVAGQWIHYCVTAIDGTAIVYINGVAQGTMSYTQSSSTNPSEGTKGFTIAGRNDSSGVGSEMNCNISEVVNYNVGLTASQVKTIYNSKEPYNHKEGVASNYLKAWYRMGDCALDDFNLIGDETNATLGSNLITSFTNGITYPFDTFSTSGNNISSAIETSGNWGGAASNSLNLTDGEIYKCTFDLTYNSGDDTLRVLLVGGASGAATSLVDVIYYTNTNGSNVFYFKVKTTDSTSHLQLGTWHSSDVINFSATNITLQKVNGNAGVMINMSAEDFEGDTP